MRNSARLGLAISALFVIAAMTPFAGAAVPSRVRSISAQADTPVPNMVSPRVRRATDLGSAPSDKTLDAVTLYLNRTPAQEAALTQLLLDQQNPSSPRFHKWLTPQQFGAQFGISASDLAKVSAWLSSKGLTVTGAVPSANAITVSGTIGQVQTAFGASIHTLSLNGEQHIANITDPVLPASIAGLVSHIGGLNDFKPKARARVRTINPRFTSSISGNHYLAPGDFYTIYDVNPLLSSSINGSGITIGVMGQTDISLPDVAAFRTAAGLPANVPSISFYNGDPGVSTGDVPEAHLDVEWAGAVAPNATILYVASSQGAFESLVQSILNNVAPILSISYGQCEQSVSLSTLNTYNSIFEQANAQGQTIVGPSGDAGATDCDDDPDVVVTTAADGLTVDFPSSSPFVTGVGGTEFNEGAVGYWNTTNGNYQGSATNYIPEMVWNDSSATYGLGASGGGASAFFSKPGWQTGTGVPNDGSRDTPDIALAASGSHDPYLICSSGSCTGGTFRNTDETLNVVGGTSDAAPSFAGILALVEQKIGGRIGNANPTIYALANSSFYNNIFHDVTVGTNNSPCAAGSPNCPTGGSIGFAAAAGYDQATGWGSVDAFNLANHWSTVATVAGAPSALSNTNLTSSAALCGIASGSLALTINVTNASTSTSLAAPTGAVQILVDNVAVGTPVALTNGSATYTLNTSALSSGGHTVAAVYNGDTTYLGSKNSLLTDVVSSTTADFALTPCTSTSTAHTGANGSPITFTITPVHGFTGAVNLSLSTDSSLDGSYLFSPSAVGISSGANGTSTLTLSAYYSEAKTGTGKIKISSVKQLPDHVAAHVVAATPTPSTSKRTPFYAAGSGVALASMLLLTLPRRPRWSALLVLILSAGIFGFGISGCGSGSTLANGGGTGGTTTTTANTPTGTYTLTVTGTSGALVHSTEVTFTVNP